MDWRDHITVDPEICHGKACMAGTRVLVTTLVTTQSGGSAPASSSSHCPIVVARALRGRFGHGVTRIGPLCCRESGHWPFGIPRLNRTIIGALGADATAPRALARAATHRRWFR